MRKKLIICSSVSKLQSLRHSMRQVLLSIKSTKSKYLEVDFEFPKFKRQLRQR
jgi:hypothetical protein